MVPFSCWTPCERNGTVYFSSKKVAILSRGFLWPFGPAAPHALPWQHFRKPDPSYSGPSKRR